MSIGDIDAVITWVDDTDEKWLEEREYWRRRVRQKTYSDNLTSRSRYRDWGLLPYVFRGIEYFAPWIRNIYFVTYGHLPAWLNTENQRLRIVNHSDFIPKEYLPTFSSCAIEFCFNRISGLSDRFIYFNDDTFLINNVIPEDFFVGYRPVLTPSESPITISKDDMFFAQYINAAIINSHFSKKTIRRRDWKKWISCKIPLKRRIENIIIGIYPTFKSFEDTHMMAPYLKSTFDILWKHEPEILDYVCSAKFRVLDGPNPWLAKCWQIATGEYVAGSPLGVHLPRRGEDFDKGTEAICEYINAKRGRAICIGEEPCSESQFDRRVSLVNNALSKILPRRSAFEC